MCTLRDNIIFVPRTPIALETPETPVPAPEERLAAALKKIREYRVTVSNGYDFSLPESHYIDFAEPDSSMHFFAVLGCIADFLKVPEYREWNLLNLKQYYDPRKAQVNSGAVTITIEQLRAAVKTRIESLGLSEVLVWEHMAALHTVEEDLAFHKLSFAERMRRFQVGE